MLLHHVLLIDLDEECYHGKMHTKSSSNDLSVNIECTPDDGNTYDISVKAYNSNAEVLGSATGLGLCMYVRREIRALTDSDLDAFLDAMYTLWEVSDEHGEKKYGSDYESSTMLTQLHHFNAGKSFFFV